MWEIEANTPMKLAVIEMKNISVTTEKTVYQKLLDCAVEYKTKYQGKNISEVDGVLSSRQLFRAIGMDPTKHRPASEALLRRALKGLDYYNINTLVDIGNWCSLDFLLPSCVYDSSKTEGDIIARLGREGECYFGHNKRKVNLQNRYLIADDKGPFGSPITDSARTTVDVNTKDAIIIIFAAQDFKEARLKKNTGILAERVKDIYGGEIKNFFILKPHSQL
ncbi:MAG: hypothetical protein K9N07_00895 [Candidatus Cloacimonetes bacterium]|nr:hypothetical protein [Candidatus Cloacimonadota bacterium]